MKKVSKVAVLSTFDEAWGGGFFGLGRSQGEGGAKAEVLFFLALERCNSFEKVDTQSVKVPTAGGRKEEEKRRRERKMIARAISRKEPPTEKCNRTMSRRRRRRRRKNREFRNLPLFRASPLSLFCHIFPEKKYFAVAFVISPPQEGEEEKRREERCEKWGCVRSGSFSPPLFSTTRKNLGKATAKKGLGSL